MYSFYNVKAAVTSIANDYSFFICKCPISHFSGCFGLIIACSWLNMYVNLNFNQNVKHSMMLKLIPATAIGSISIIRLVPVIGKRAAINDKQAITFISY